MTARAFWERGLNLKFNAENPSAAVYQVIHNAIKDKVPDPVNRAIVLWYGAMQPPQIDIKLEMPDQFLKFLKVMPSPGVMDRDAQEAELRALQRGMKLIPEVLNEPKQLPQALGKYALEWGADALRAQVKVAQELGAQAAQAANEGIKAVNDISRRTAVGIPGAPDDWPKMPIVPSIPTSLPSVPKSTGDVIRTAICPFCPH